ncbi:SM-like, degradation of cytoplasmic mRNAs and positively regulates transcription initiation [Varicellaria rhodocarpa]|nr:SM-like, degradation of cytoplasmic mRNAs and positively regulates transcription initiation [Varicellaria rhodocarpa]
MENLSLQDVPPSSASNNTHASLVPHGVPQLPPQMFTTAAQLLDLTDSETTLPNGISKLEKVMLVLRDGRKLIGVLRSWDQFANLVIRDTVERIYIQDLYADVPCATNIIRGENVLLLGEIDLDKDDYVPEPFRRADESEVKALFRQHIKDRKKKDKVQQAKLQELGFEAEHTGEILF